MFKLEVLCQLKRLRKDNETIMATLAELQQSITDLQTATTDALLRVSEDVQHLKDQIAAGQGIQPVDLDLILAGIQATVATLKGVDPIADFPPPPVA